jgi:hypothetical protein
MYEKILLRLDKVNDIFYNLNSDWIKFRAQGVMIIYIKKSNALRYQSEDFNE